MNIIKNKYRAVLTDKDLKNFILLGSPQIAFFFNISISIFTFYLDYLITE
jgi:hypothetical protein